MNVKSLTSVAVLFSALVSAPGCAGGSNAAAAGSVADDSNAVADLTSETAVSAVAVDAALDAATAPDTAAAVACGSAVGDVLCEAALQGYFRNETKGLATTADFGEFNLNNVASSVPQKYIVVLNGAWW